MRKRLTAEMVKGAYDRAGMGSASAALSLDSSIKPVGLLFAVAFDQSSAQVVSSQSLIADLKNSLVQSPIAVCN